MMLNNTAKTPLQLTPLEVPIVQQNEITGLITVHNFCIHKGNREYITIEFRDLNGADDDWIRKLNEKDSPISTDWIILSKVCIRWGEDESVTSGEFTSKDIPYSNLMFLREQVLPLLFPSYRTA